jgi:hypothetical protein
MGLNVEVIGNRRLHLQYGRDINQIPGDALWDQVKVRAPTLYLPTLLRTSAEIRPVV